MKNMDEGEAVFRELGDAARRILNRARIQEELELIDTNEQDLIESIMEETASELEGSDVEEGEILNEQTP